MDKKVLVVGILSSALVMAATAQANVHKWSQSYGDAGYQQVGDAAIDSSGNMLVTGRLDGELDFGSGVVAGEQDTYVAKIHRSGQVIWTHHFGDNADPIQAGNEIITDSRNNVIIVGYHRGPFNVGPDLLEGSPTGGTATFVIKLDSQGNYLWSREYFAFGSNCTGNGCFSISARALSVDGEGNIYIAGRVRGHVDLGGGPLYDVRRRDGVFAVKLDKDGGHVWSDRYGAGDAYLLDATNDSQGNYILAGRLQGAVDFGGGARDGDTFMVKLDAMGNHLWSHDYSAIDGDMVFQQLAVDPNDAVVATGTFEGPIDFQNTSLAGYGDRDLFIARFSSDTGADEWSQAYGSEDEDTRTSGLAVGPDGSMTFVGLLESTIDFGGGPITGEESTDMFMTTIDADGSYRCARAIHGDGTELDRPNVAVSQHGIRLVAGTFYDGPIDMGGGELVESEDGVAIYMAAYHGGWCE